MGDKKFFDRIVPRENIVMYRSEINKNLLKDDKGYPFKGKKYKKTATLLGDCFDVGTFLLSQAVASQVSSALMSLTSVFGMGTGGPSSSSTPTLFSTFLSK